MKYKTLENDLKNCRTEKQVVNLLEKNGYKIVKDDSLEVGCFSVWLDDTTRIYKRHKTKIFILQRWEKCTMKYSGIPVFFG